MRKRNLSLKTSDVYWKFSINVIDVRVFLLCGMFVGQYNNNFELKRGKVFQTKQKSKKKKKHELAL